MISYRKFIPRACLSKLAQWETVNLSHNKLETFLLPSIVLNIRIVKLDLCHNALTDISGVYCIPTLVFFFVHLLICSYHVIKQKILLLSNNHISLLKPEIMTSSPQLEVLDVSYNKLDDLDTAFASLKEFNAVGNPLSAILPGYRNDKDKVLPFLVYLTLLINS